jgi:hypothetical protein
MARNCCQRFEESIRQEIDSLRAEVLRIRLREDERGDGRESPVTGDVSRLPSYRTVQDSESG